MMFRVAVLGALLALAGCGDRPQGLGGIKQDTAPYQGSTNAAFTEPGWKSGDKTSWEQQLKNRTQAQNDYVKAH